MSESEHMIEELMDLLGNKTRRRILESLSKEPLYITQMIDMLNVQAQAIMRHLKKLEQRGFVHSYEQASLGGPPRKYYAIKNAMQANVIIGPHTFSLKLTPGIEEQKKQTRSLPKHVPSQLEILDLKKAIKKVLEFLNQSKSTKEIKTTVNVLESLKETLMGEIK
ncbi:MAG: ArsR/SmtB family transcription factor [Candidatus Heimdallarchaeota archaeon]